MENKELAKQKVETTNRSYRAIAAEHKTSHTTLQNIAKNDKWDTSHRVSKVSKKTAEKSPRKAHNKILGTIALRKMEELISELGSNYSNIDEPLIVMYAKNYERYIDLEKELDSGGILSRSIKTGTEYLSPNFIAMLSIQKSLIAIAGQLGLSLASRKKLGIVIGKDEDEGQLTIYDIIKASINNIKDDEDDGII